MQGQGWICLCHGSHGRCKPIVSYELLLTRFQVINVAGHRISTGHLEEVVGLHPAVAECAVFGVPDNLKGKLTSLYCSENNWYFPGELPIALIVLKNGTLNSSVVPSVLLPCGLPSRGGPLCLHCWLVRRRSSSGSAIQSELSAL
jgi:acyl-CoA synthetase (AMP-forming)/AMP-acid ligase II